MTLVLVLIGCLFSEPAAPSGTTMTFAEQAFVDALADCTKMNPRLTCTLTELGGGALSLRKSEYVGDYTTDTEGRRTLTFTGEVETKNTISFTDGPIYDVMKTQNCTEGCKVRGVTWEDPRHYIIYIGETGQALCRRSDRLRVVERQANACYYD